MSCCGKNRQLVAQSVATKPAASRAVAVVPAQSVAVGRAVPGFTVVAEYRGAGQVVAQGPVSGKRYVFPTTGARQLIDVRDRDLARTVRGLRLLEPG